MENQAEDKHAQQGAALAKNTLFLSAGNLVSKGINFIMVPLFSSWVTAGEYGIYDLYCTYAMLLVPFISLACSESLFRFGIDTKKRKDLIPLISCAFTIDLIGYMFAAVAIGIIGVLFSWNYAFPFALLLLGELGMNHLQGVLRALKKLPLYSLINIIITCFIALITTILVLLFGLGLMGIILGYALGYICGCLIALAKIKYWQFIRFSQVSVSVIKKMVKYSSLLIPNNISWWIISVSDRIIINIFLGPVYNGIYAIACKLSNFCVSVFGVFNMSWQQSASEMVEDAERNKYYSSVLNNLACLLISFSSIVLMLNFPLFDLLFDYQYFEGFLYFPILVTSVIASSLALYFGGLQISLKRPAANGVTTVAGAFANIFINLLFIPLFGLYAAASSTLFANVLIVVLRWFALRATIKLSIDCKAIILSLTYIYFFVMSYICHDYIFLSLNLLAAVIIAYLVNQQLLKGFISRILVKIRD